MLCCADVTQPSLTAAAELTDDQVTTMNVALLVIVPLFLVCYCGSCVAYMVYKIYRNCFRRHTKSHGVNLEGIDSQAPPAFPAYLHGPGQPVPPGVKSESLRGGPSVGEYVKSPLRHDDQAAYSTTGPPVDNRVDVPIAEILMKKMAGKSSATAY